MSATAAQIAQLRRMVAEADDTTYDDDALAGYIEAYPRLDERGEEPYTWDTSTEPPSEDENESWIPTYDLNAAAADIWEEKAAAVASEYNFSADGGKYDLSKKHEQYLKMARRYSSKRCPTTVALHKWPDEVDDSWIVNAAESD